MLRGLPPWDVSRTADKLPQRDAFPDAAVAFQPWAAVARREVRDGELPLWNPYEYGGGMALLGNMQSALLFPLTWLLLVFPAGYAWGALAAGRVLIAGLGAYALARELRADWGGAVLAGTVYMLSAPLTAAIQYPFGSTFALFPWLLFASERLLRRPSPGAVAGVASATALTIFSGHPESALIAVSAAAVYVAARRGRSLRAFASWGAGLALGAVISAVALIPFLQTLGPSVTRLSHESTLAPFDLPLSTVLQYVFPDLFGNGEPHVYGVPLYVTVAGYFGVPALVLALVALVRRRGDPAIVALAAMALVGLMAVYRLPPVIWFLRHVPPWSHSWVDERAYFVVALAAAVAAGVGFASLRRRPLPAGRAAAVIAAVAGAAAIAFVLAGWRGGLPAPASVKRHSVEMAALFLALSGCLLAALGRMRTEITAALALGLAVLSLVHLQDLNVALPPERAYPGTPPAVRMLEREPRPFRIALDRRPGQQPLPANTQALYGLEAIEGYDYPLSKRWSDFQTRVLRFGGRSPESRSPRRPPAGTALTALRMMNTRYYVAAPGTKPPAAGMRTVFAGPGAVVFRDPEALPRAYVVPRTRALSDREALAALAAGRFDPRRTAIVPSGQRTNAPRSGRLYAARAESDGNDHVRVRVPDGSGGWLVLANAYSPQWRAKVDGRAVDLRPTNFAAMGVPVGAGAHTVDFRLDRTGFWIGLALSLAGLAATALLALAGRLRRPAQSPEPDE